MDDLNMSDQSDDATGDVVVEKTIMFECPNCGKTSRDEVIFLCNNCKEEEVLLKDGMYICPACMTPGKNFECMNCGSKEVKMLGSIS